MDKHLRNALVNLVYGAWRSSDRNDTHVQYECKDIDLQALLRQPRSPCRISKHAFAMLVQTTAHPTIGLITIAVKASILSQATVYHGIRRCIAYSTARDDLTFSSWSIYSPCTKLHRVSQCPLELSSNTSGPSKMQYSARSNANIHIEIQHSNSSATFRPSPKGPYMTLHFPSLLVKLVKILLVSIKLSAPPPRCGNLLSSLPSNCGP